MPDKTIEGYKLGYYKQASGRIREAMITLEILTSSKLIDERQHEIYDFLKTDLVKILKIESLYVDNRIDSAYIYRKGQELQYEVKVGEIVRFKHSDFKDPQPDNAYISVFTSKAGALNGSREAPSNFTGTRLYYYPNGRLKEKHYYVAGFKTHTYGYYNSEFNPMNFCWTFESRTNQTFPIIREYLYNLNENPIAQYIIHEGRITNKTVYLPNERSDSIYLQRGEL